MRRGRRGSISISTLSQISCDRRLWRKDFEKRKTSTYWPDWVRGRNCHHDHPLAVGVPHLVYFAAVRLPSSGSFAARLCAGFLYNDASRAKKSSENWKKTGKCMVLWASPVRKVELDYFGIATGSKQYTLNVEVLFKSQRSKSLCGWWFTVSK